MIGTAYAVLPEFRQAVGGALGVADPTAIATGTPRSSPRPRPTERPGAGPTFAIPTFALPSFVLPSPDLDLEALTQYFDFLARQQISTSAVSGFMTQIQQAADRSDWVTAGQVAASIDQWVLDERAWLSANPPKGCYQMIWTETSDWLAIWDEIASYLHTWSVDPQSGPSISAPLQGAVDASDAHLRTMTTTTSNTSCEG